MRLFKEDSAVLIIDIQERLLPHIAEKESLLEKNKTLIEGLKVLGVPVIVTEQYKKGLGATIEPIVQSIGTFEGIEKTTFSCCHEPNFVKALQSTSKRNVIIAGIESHVCVLQTVLDLIEMGYRAVVVEDCVSSRNLNDKNIAIQRMRSEGAIITSCESLLFELCQKAGSPEFKAISKLVK